ALPPEPDRIRLQRQLARDLAVVQALGREQHDPRSMRQLLAGRVAPDQPFQLASFFVCQVDRRWPRARHRILHSRAGDAILTLPTVFSQGVLVLPPLPTFGTAPPAARRRGSGPGGDSGAAGGCRPASST